MSSVGILSPLNYSLFAAHVNLYTDLQVTHLISTMCYLISFPCSFLGHTRTSESPPCSIVAKQSGTECDEEVRRVGCRGGMGSLISQRLSVSLLPDPFVSPRVLHFIKLIFPTLQREKKINSLCYLNSKVYTG